MDVGYQRSMSAAMNVSISGLRQGIGPNGSLEAA